MNKESINIINNFCSKLKKLIVFATGLHNSDEEQKAKLERYRALALNFINYDPLSVVQTVGSKLFENKEIIQHADLNSILEETVDGKYKAKLEGDKFTSTLIETIKNVHNVTTDENKSIIVAETNELLSMYIDYLISTK